jgi:outer membrane protein, heavy metal efflux system
MRGHPFLLLMLLVAPAAQADPQPLVLDAAIEQALLQAPVLSARQADVEAARALAIGSGRLPDPELVIGIDNLPVNGADAYSTTRDFMTMRKAGVMQEFPAARKRRLQRQRAELETNIAEAELVQARLEVAREVAEAWLRRATAEVSLQDLRALEPEAQLQAAAARAALAAGRGSSVDALAAEAAVVQLANRILDMHTQVERASIGLERWIDVPADTPLGPMPALDHLPASVPELLAGIQQHAALRPYESRTEAARVDVDLARAARRPDFSAQLAFAKRGAEFPDMVTLEFRVGLPLFSRYRQDPLISARHAQLRRLEAQRDDELRMHTAELRDVVAQWELLGKQLQRYQEELLPLARERSRAALASYKAGRGELRLALEAFAQEVDFIVERTQLQNERGRAWAYLRFLGPEHLHP